ncbi:cytochrome c oxidase assembly protein [Methylococcus capsulatus]|uniref:cytochrome c oxidase assembly protein n=1 Tax=Methylococcus capsulatus TaxID=414 RepID=UPI001C52832C|nr:cytochrome c oxidase assembly protein [Methylococcus capsulatus]QXP88348.1 cytochrome c oxidase assembly protein [Methylococcus capsulatus]QXP94635.1 cytochrome c oxidase assembly protein [Methylococcus capsulatus]UQN13388.1 cytochrome c oxidase assembly protein [Methylococcus capsulatus]
MSHQETDKRKHGRLVWGIVFVALAMFGFGFALAPFYSLFCEITGLNGKVRTEAVDEVAYDVDVSREITIEFVTELNERMPLAFSVETSKMKIHPGQYYTVKFYGENLTDRPMLGRAIPSITPGTATAYLKKTECFCFSEQRFEPHQRREMPVRFVIDPGLPKDIKEMALSYTFFDISDTQKD